MKPSFLTYNVLNGEYFVHRFGERIQGTLAEEKRETVERMCDQLGQRENERFTFRHDRISDTDAGLYEQLLRTVVTVASDPLDVEFIARAMGTGTEPRSIRAVILDDQPREIFQPGLGLITEQYKLDGVTVRNQKSTPLVDGEGDNINVRDVLGSVRNVTVNQGALIGEVRFASDRASQQAYSKYRDGHLKEFKAVMRRLKREQKADGAHVITESELILVRLGVV